MGTKIYLNVYDLMEGNEFLYNVGMGLHHSGVEILGSEYSFASGAGIFDSTPKEVPNAKFRESILMGVYEGTSNDVRSVISNLRSDFSGDSYNLILRNCNHFSNALCWALLQKTIPGYVNRLADFGGCCKCLIPKQMLENAPVGDTNHAGGGGSMSGGGGGDATGNSSSGFQVYGKRNAHLTKRTNTTAFSGKGATLGSSTSSSSPSSTPNNSSYITSISGRLTGAFQSSNTSNSNSNNNNNSSIDEKRERARKAALARFERGDEANHVTNESNKGGLKSN